MTEPSRPGLLPGWDATDPAGAAAPEPEPGPTPLVGSTPPGTFGLRILGVSEVTRAVRDAIRAEERLRDVWVEGEVGRVTVSSAGHAYFTLKDERNAIQCVWFRDERVRSAFQPQAGLRIVVHGRVDLFEPQGALQLYVESIQPAGFGDLTLRFEALKARLAEEGLFDTSRKRPLPTRPATIGVITSPTGVVWRDVGNVLARRWPLARVILVACQVQGEEAPASIVGAFRRLERWIEQCGAEGRPEDAPQVTILARGGGSLEDLWSFNDERVVRAVVGHAVPVVCGVGHEVDVTLADFAADVRAPTPSAAAELVVPDRAEWEKAFRRAADRIAAAATARLAASRRELEAERRALARLDPLAQLATSRERVGLLLDRAVRAVEAAIGRRRATLDSAAATVPQVATARLRAARLELDTASAALAVLDPQATLDRGYAIVRRAEDERIVRAPDEAPPETRLSVRLARGELAATVDGPAERA
ncbi:MAG TPA: exodeoxyribonuclease VII large subunit [Candidatus Limnocylindrales bacterium]|nr:exodeoxyribonuclease VII large subunit [Candidatus Limnocylindrales bacterium]